MHLAGHGAGHVLAAPPLARCRAGVLVGEHTRDGALQPGAARRAPLLERRAPGRGDPYPCRTVGGAGSPVPGVALPPVLSPRWHQCRNRGQRAGRERRRQSGVRGALRFLRSRAASDLVCYIEPLLRAAEKDMAALDLVLLPHCARCTEFATTVYWRAHTHPRASEAVLAVVPAAHRAALLRSRRFACALVSDIVHQRQQCAEFVPCLLPGACDVTVVGVHISMATTAQSASCPVVIPLSVRRHRTEEHTIQEVLYKPAACRKDRCVLDVVRYLRTTFSSDDTASVYDVILMEPDCALIMMVSGAVTLYSVHASRMDVCSYVMECNLSESLQSIRQRFIAAAAFSCCLCLFLGIGDRHLENIMVTERGELFHIDFEYILGEQPSGNLLTPGWALRVTPDMVRMMGGDGSVGVDTFREACADLMLQFRSRISDVVPILRCGYPAAEADRPALFMEQWAKKRMDSLDVLVDTEAMNSSRRTLYRVLDWLHDMRRKLR